MFNSGYLTLGRWRGTLIRVHWSTPAGAWVFTGFQFLPIAWLGVFLIILVHEAGHALMARWARAWVHSVDIDAIGGRCTWEGQATPLQRACIAFAGVWAQLLLCAVGALLLQLPEHALGGHYGVKLIEMFIRPNLALAAFNLLPIRPLDGAEAWKFFPLLARHLRGLIRRTSSKQKGPFRQRQQDKLHSKGLRRPIPKEKRWLH